jgi:hypothetical protein
MTASVGDDSRAPTGPLTLYRTKLHRSTETIGRAASDDDLALAISSGASAGTGTSGSLFTIDADRRKHEPPTGPEDRVSAHEHRAGRTPAATPGSAGPPPTVYATASRLMSPASKPVRAGERLATSEHPSDVARSRLRPRSTWGLSADPVGRSPASSCPPAPPAPSTSAPAPRTSLPGEPPDPHGLLPVGEAGDSR